MAFSSSLPRLLRRTSSSLPLRWRLRMFLAGKRSRPFTTCEGSRPTILHKRSIDILHDPWFNKGTAFSITERDRLDLRGLLPPNVMTPRQQINRFMVDLKRLELNASDGPSDTIALAKWRILNRLHDRNETMYYKVLIENIKEYAPIVYTPTVGRVCQNYSGLFRRPRGMYFSAADHGEMMSMVDMIVVTDGSRILGLGDLGVQGIGIAIGKLDLYVAAAGINPQRFEDFQSKWAFKLLQRYRSTYRMFNDDVQGTAGVAIAGLLGAVRAQGKPMIDFPKQKIVVAGAGSAGIGVLNAARKTMARMLGNNEFAFEGARSQFWVVDAMGLLTEGRMNIDPEALPFARKLKESERHGLHEGASLAEVVTKVKPDVLLGLSAVGGLFSKEVLEALKDSSSTRPAIFAMSNPTQNAECTPEEAFSTVGDHIVFASGSPFHDVDLGNGKIGHCNQGNNMYLFPGIRDITKEVAAAVVREAVAEDLAEGYRDMDPQELKKLTPYKCYTSSMGQQICGFILSLRVAASHFISNLLRESDPCTWSYLHILLQCLLEPNTFFVLEFYRSIGNLKDVLSSICSYMDNELIIIF
ncbi:malic enzyme [Musa troglodytarum]|uniref:Malic enzyme n=1 Tax=Musa troglodytarum TaxID=320322 RepID=A0A9E7KKJ2_9LILI|nr:malic enzyme [Musa troglodytarum]